MMRDHKPGRTPARCGPRLRMQPVRDTLTSQWREMLGATDDVLERWPEMSEAERRPYRLRERDALDEFTTEIERAAAAALSEERNK